MSYGWSLHCELCGKSVGSINRGQRDWPDIVAAWPRIRAALDALEPLSVMLFDWDIRIYSLDCGCYAEDVWLFLRQHHGHGLAMIDEYDEKLTPISEPSPRSRKLLRGKRYVERGEAVRDMADQDRISASTIYRLMRDYKRWLASRSDTVICDGA